VNRISLAGLGLLAWQLCSMAIGFNEFMFGHPAPVAATLASLATALAWPALAAWAGYRRRAGFAIFAVVLWAAIIAVLLLAMWTRQSDGGAADALLPLLILAGGPLYGLGSWLPMEDALLATTAVAAAILGLVVVAFLLGRGLGRKGRLPSGHPHAAL